MPQQHTISNGIFHGIVSKEEEKFLLDNQQAKLKETLSVQILRIYEGHLNKVEYAS
jgi:hypothetical protein